MEDELNEKVKKIVLSPRLSLTQFSRYCAATENGKNRIVLNSKYTGDYIPKYYDIARRIVCEVFSANLDDHDEYFEVFKTQAVELKAKAKPHPVNTDKFKNNEYSAEGLLALTKVSKQIEPILKKYILRSNLKNGSQTITIEGVKISSKADMLLFEDAGLTKVGFVKFNFTKQPIKKKEAEYLLYALWAYHQQKGDEFNISKCLLIDIYAGKIYSAIDHRFMEEPTRKLCLEINNKWKTL